MVADLNLIQSNGDSRFFYLKKDSEPSMFCFYVHDHIFAGCY